MTAANIYPPMSGSRQAAQPQWAQLFASGVPRAAESAPRTLHLQIAWERRANLARHVSSTHDCRLLSLRVLLLCRVGIKSDLMSKLLLSFMFQEYRA
jgi:hypothetical protein